MKTKTYYLALAIAVGTVCIPAVDAAERPLSEDKPFLIAHAYPALTGIGELYVAIMQQGRTPSEDALVGKELRAKVEQKLVKAGIKMCSGDVRTYPAMPEAPVLTVDADILRLKDSQQHVFCIRTSLERPVCLPKEYKITSSSELDLILRADVWKKGSSIQIVSAENLAAAVTEVVLEQVEAFIHAHLAANPPGKQPLDVRLSDLVSPTTAKAEQPTTQAVAEYGYVASKNSEVFHKAGCRWAKRISQKNLVRYNSREEAIKAGKRPCKMCKP